MVFSPGNFDPGWIALCNEIQASGYGVNDITCGDSNLPPFLSYDVSDETMSENRNMQSPVYRITLSNQASDHAGERIPCPA
jgi:hypothetical protein